MRENVCIEKIAGNPSGNNGGYILMVFYLSAVSVHKGDDFNMVTST